MRIPFIRKPAGFGLEYIRYGSDSGEVLKNLICTDYKSQGHTKMAKKKLLLPVMLP